MMINIKLEHIVAPNASNGYALQTAKWCVQNNETSVLKAILETNLDKSNLSDFGEECAKIPYESIDTDENESLEMLLEHLNENFLKQTFGNGKKTFLSKLLCNAVESGQYMYNKIQSLVNKRAEVNYCYQGKPLLHLALELGCMDVVRALVDAGADVSVLAKRGNGPLVAAIQSTAPNKVKNYIFKAIK